MSTVDGRCVCGLVVKVLDMISMQVRIPIESKFGVGVGCLDFSPWKNRIVSPRKASYDRVALTILNLKLICLYALA